MCILLYYRANKLMKARWKVGTKIELRFVLVMDVD